MPTMVSIAFTNPAPAPTTAPLGPSGNALVGGAGGSGGPTVTVTVTETETTTATVQVGTVTVTVVQG